MDPIDLVHAIFYSIGFGGQSPSWFSAAPTEPERRCVLTIDPTAQAFDTGVQVSEERLP